MNETNNNNADVEKGEKFILAIDHGTSGPKPAIISTKGKVIDWVFKEVPLHLPEPGAAEQDPEDWWKAIVEGTKEMLSRGKVSKDDIVGICNTSQWSGTIPMDRDGNHLMNCIIWMDTRGAEQVNKLHKSPLQVSGYSLFKILKWIGITGGGPTLSGKDPIAHIMWLKEKRPEIYNKTYKFLEPQDYINYRLTGKMASSEATIHLHWVTDINDINEIKYSQKLIKKLKIDPSKFPEIKKTTDILGTLTKEAAAELGLNPDTKVIMGVPDLHSATIGSGAVKDFEAHFCIGTSDWLICHVPYKKTDIFHNMASAPSGIPGRYMIINEQEIAGGALTYLRDNILYHKDELLRESIINELLNVYDQINGEVDYRQDLSEEEKAEIRKRLDYYKDVILKTPTAVDIYEILDEIIKEISEEQEKVSVNLDFLKSKILSHKERLERGDPLRNIYKLFDRIVEKTPAGANNLIFTPWLFGERSPVDDHTVRGGFYNISLDTTREHLIRAVFEGVAFNIKWLLFYVEKFIKKWVKKEKPEQIKDGKIMPELIIIGGGANSKIWCQIFADVTDRAIKQVKDPIQVNARGAAFLASVALGYIKWDDIGDLVEYNEVFNPNPETRKLYDGLFEEFKNIYKVMGKTYKRLNKLH